MSTAHSPDCTCREHPLPASMSVRAARDVYLAENGFTVAAYEDEWTKASFFGVPLRVPNTKTHRWAIMLHDLHHVATGYGTDLAGEAEVSAWEARRGLRVLGLYVASIVAGGAALGLALWPRRVVEAWRASGDDGRKALWGMDRAYDALLEMSVGALRELLGVPREGLARTPRRLHPDAPKASAAGERAPEVRAESAGGAPG